MSQPTSTSPAASPADPASAASAAAAAAPAAVPAAVPERAFGFRTRALHAGGTPCSCATSASPSRSAISPEGLPMISTYRAFVSGRNAAR